MNVMFVSRPNVFSWLLKTATWSDWAHCGILTPEGTVIESAPFLGVVERSREEFLKGVTRLGQKDIVLPGEAAAIAFARAQIGKSYDWRGVAGIGLRQDEWNRKEFWFCNELIEAACMAGGRARFIYNAGRVTPQHSWMVA